MGINEYLAPFKWMDEQVLRQYTTIGKRFEDKGIRPEYVGLSYTLILGGFTLPAWAGLEVVANGNKLKYDNNQAEAIAHRVLTKTFADFGKIGRFPLFCMAVGEFTVGACYLISGLKDKDMAALGDAFQLLFSSLSVLSIPSSMYLRDRDPKLLDKQPVWKTVIDYIKEKTTPRSVPEPAASRTIDDCAAM